MIRCAKRRLQDKPWDPERIARIKGAVAKQLGIASEACDHFVLTDKLVNNGYDNTKDRIELLYKDGTLRDIAEASDTLGIQALSKPVVKWYLAYPRWMGSEWFG